MFQVFVEGLTEPPTTSNNEISPPTLEGGLEGESSVLKTAETGNVSLLETICNEGNINNDINGFGVTVLMLKKVCSAKGHVVAVEMLLGIPGINVDAVDKYRRTALIWAASGGHDAIIHCLLEAGAQIDHLDMFGRTPLFCAIDGSRERTIILLLDFFADVNKLKKPSSQYPKWVLDYAQKVKGRSIGKKNALGKALAETPKRNSRRPVAILLSPQNDDIEFVAGDCDKIDKADMEWASTMLASSEPFKTLGRTPEMFINLFQTRPGYLYILAKVKGERAGIAIIKPWGFASSPYLTVLGVAPAHRGAGLGEKLLEKFENTFSGTKHFFLLCSSFNTRAQSFYERHGYVKRGEIPDYIIQGASEFIYHKAIDKCLV